MVGESEKHRYLALDSLRGICACMVALLHFVTPGYIVGAPVVKNAWLFVDFFFVLSGFVIGSSYGDRLSSKAVSLWTFMTRRLWRLYPLHVVMMLVFLAFELFFAQVTSGSVASRQPFTGVFSIEGFFQTLFLVQIFVGPDATPWNGPSWSIAAELWTYLIFALVLRYARWLLLPLCCLVAVVAPIYISDLTDRNMNLFHDGALVRCLFGFSLGIVGWRMAERIEAITLPRIADTLLELLAVVAVVALVSLAGAGPLSLAAPFLFFAVVLIFARENGAVSSLLRRRALVGLGTLSYSIYMIHGFIAFRFANLTDVLQRKPGVTEMLYSGGPLVGDAFSLAYLAMVIVGAWFTHRWIEEPGREIGRRLTSPSAARSDRRS